MTLDKNDQDLILELNNFVAGLDEHVREAAFNFLLTQSVSAQPKNEPAAAAPPAKKDRELSPQELIRQTNATSATAKAIVLAYWLELHQAKENISSSELKDAFNLAREPAPKNPSDVVARLAAAGKLMPSEKVGGVQNYRLTRTAIDEVESWLRSGQHE